MHGAHSQHPEVFTLKAQPLFITIVGVDGKPSQQLTLVEIYGRLKFSSCALFRGGS